MFEHRSQPLLPMRAFIRRVIRHAGIALGMVAAALAAGILGYHLTENLPWIDALLNAAMILGGMGPVNVLHTTAGKIFASAYALFSGLLFLVVAGVLFAPIVHRFLHRLHLDADAERRSRTK